jgi:hypothetical protein
MPALWLSTHRCLSHGRIIVKRNGSRALAARTGIILRASGIPTKMTSEDIDHS